MNKKWQIQDKMPKDLLQRFPEINPVTLQLLYNRGLQNQEKIDEFFYPDYSQDVHDPYLLSNMQKVVDRIKKVKDKGEKVAVHGDYDADGVTATVVLAKTLQIYGINPEIYIPHRDKEGYGLNKNTVQYFKKQGINLIITLDCGITNVEEVSLANELGMEVIVADHHEIEDELPSAHAIIHTRLKGSKYPFGSLAGVGVAFKIAQALLLSQLKPYEEIDKESFEKWLLDLVAIGTIADVVQLVGENRTLVRYGLMVLSKSKSLGLKELIKICRFKDNSIDSIGVAFRIAPRINAAGRMDHASTAYELLTTKNEDEAVALAKRLEGSNQERQSVTEKILGEAVLQIGESPKEKLLIPFNKDWPKSLAGLVAGKLVDRYNRPVILMGGQNDQIYGSGRSLPGFNLAETIQELDGFFRISGGHPMAAGFTLKDKDQFDEFMKSIKNIAEKEIDEAKLVSVKEIDVELDFDQVDWRLHEDLEKFEPFGEGNRRPLFLCRNLDIVNMESVGMGNKHVRFMLDYKGKVTRKVMAFGFAKACSNLSLGDKIDIVFEVGVNEWNGNRELQLKLVDFIQAS